MKKRSLHLIVALGLLTSLAFATPSRAGTVPFSVVTVTGGGTITGVLFAGNASSPAPSLTITDVTAPGTQQAVTPVPTGMAALTLGGATMFPIGTYALHNVPPPGSNSLYSLSGSVTQIIEIKDQASGQTGTLSVTDSVNTLVGSVPGFTNEGPVQPQVVPVSPNAVVLGDFKYTIYYESQVTVTGQAFLTVAIGAQAVPEPASMSLLGIGMAGFLAFRRFFDKRATKI